MLVVEDDELDLFIAERVLKSMDFAEHIETLSGIDTALIRLVNGKQLPDFIFLGLYSRYRDGFDFLREISHLSEDLRRIKIIVLSSSPFQADEEKAKTYKQVAAYFQKPIEINGLKLLCNNLAGS